MPPLERDLVSISSLSSTLEDARGAQDQHEEWAENSLSPAFLPPPLSAEPPTVQVTRHTAQDGGITLKCWARGFYPRDISLSWWLGEEELVLETEYVETRPSGDGTYQTWAAVRVPARKEDWYTCHVQHSGLNHTLTVAWGEELGLVEGVGRSRGGCQGTQRKSHGLRLVPPFLCLPQKHPLISGKPVLWLSPLSSPSLSC